MSEEDDAWAFGWMADHPSIEECSSARVSIEGITHRALNQGRGGGRVAEGWRTLCGSHRLICFAGKTFVPSGTNKAYGFSSASVDCLCCIPAGG